MLLYVNRYKWVVDWIFVIVRAISLYTTFYIVSIHLMLLFIGVIFNSCRWCKRFNTSHVTLYPSLERRSSWYTIVSIHLMLLFIPKGTILKVFWIGFQYISCYSLSEMKRSMNGIRICFNTSHVTLYHLDITRLMRIVCSFNTSHVTLYRNSLDFGQFWKRGFNTSHVTLYRICCFRCSID